MYISSVKLNDFRCYRRAETTFVHPGSKADLPARALKNVTLLVGVNGSGKTSILRSVALATLAPVIGESGYRPYYLVRRPRVGSLPIQKGNVSVAGVLDKREAAKIDPLAAPGEAPDSLANMVEITRRGDYDVLQFGQLAGGATKDKAVVPRSSQREGVGYAYVYNHKTEAATRGQLFKALEEYFEDFSASFFLVGYGANRRVEEPGRSSVAATVKARGRRYLRVAGLFEEGVTLSPFASWLPQLARTKRHEEVVKLLNRTLPTGTRFSGRYQSDQQPIFRHHGVELPFPALSDGYRSYVGLIGDILSHLNECCPKGLPLTELTGVVMVDDIDLHLHPQWQRVVVPRLAKAFPKLQFILTTHSPLVAGTVHAANVRVIGEKQVHQFSERLHGLSVDQILSGPYFGYTAPRSDESERHLEELLKGPVDVGDGGAALEFLRELAGETPSSK